MSDPNAPYQYGNGPEERATPEYNPNDPQNPYGSPYGAPDPRQTQPSGPYQAPNQSGEGAQGAPVPVIPNDPYGQPAAPSGGYPQYQQPYPPYPQYPQYPAQAPSGGYPQQAPSGGYAQPGGPSGAYPQQGYNGPYSQPLAPGQMGPQGAPMGQYAPYSQTLPGYGQPGAPSQVGPYDPTIAGQPYPPSGPAPAPRRSRRGLWIALAVVVVLAIVGGGAGYYVLSYLPTQARAAVNAAATSFCADLTSQNYVSAYQATSSTLQTQYTQTQFTNDFTTLDKAEGTATACTGALNFASSPFNEPTSATYATTLTRSTQGGLQGALHLKEVGGVWKVDAIDTALLGVNLGAVQAVQAYCAALQTQDYTTAYGLLDPSLQSGTTASDFTTTEQLHDTINGKVTNCTITAVGQGNSNTTAGLTENITRANLAAQTGTVTLGATGAKWLITQLAKSAEGEDVGPYQVGVAFCADIAAGNYQDAYNLTSSNFQSGGSESTFASIFQPVAAQGVTFSCGQPDLTTYQVSGSNATFTMPFIESYQGNTVTLKMELSFINDGTKWQVDNFNFTQ